MQGGVCSCYLRRHGFIPNEVWLDGQRQQATDGATDAPLAFAFDMRSRAGLRFMPTSNTTTIQLTTTRFHSILHPLLLQIGLEDDIQAAQHSGRPLPLVRAPIASLYHLTSNLNFPTCHNLFHFGIRSQRHRTSHLFRENSHQVHSHSVKFRLTGELRLDYLLSRRRPERASAHLLQSPSQKATSTATIPFDII